MITKSDLTNAKKEFAKSQKHGIHFLCASICIWTWIQAVQFMPLSQYYQNALSLYSSALLVPLAILFSKIFKIKFSDKDNPLQSAGIVFALNQLLYLPVVMLVWFVAPDKMLMAYAMVVGAHFLPYSWLYDSIIYRVFSILIVAATLIVGIYGSVAVVAAVMILTEVTMVILFMKLNPIIR